MRSGADERKVRTGNRSIDEEEDGDFNASGESPLYDWFATSPLLPRILLMMNTVLLVALVLIMIVVYVRVQSALDAVDSLTQLPKFPK